jgi:RNA polymerase sigma-70 factor (ECF subfamily)
MADGAEFADFIRRIRTGDNAAAADLVRRYEPLVRREVRLHLDDRRLGRLFDAADVCQSVMASFLVRVAAGQYDLGEADRLPRLLARMARNKVADAVRRQTRQRRDHRRMVGGESHFGAAAGGGPTPSRVVAGKELLARVHELFTAEERQVADLRAQGLAWAEIAGRLGGTGQARRMQLARAADRAARALGLADDPPAGS